MVWAGHVGDGKDRIGMFGFITSERVTGELRVAPVVLLLYGSSTFPSLCRLIAVKSKSLEVAVANWHAVVDISWPRQAAPLARRTRRRLGSDMLHGFCDILD